jgi:DNA-binding transcriptional ArsR family regulator
LQAVSRHIQVLVRAGLVHQERTGRISRCRLDVGPIYSAALWINRYSKYWQEQFGMLAAALEEIGEQKPRPASRRKRRRRRAKARRRTNASR